MRIIIYSIIGVFLLGGLFSYRENGTKRALSGISGDTLKLESHLKKKTFLEEVRIRKELLYDKHTLEEVYPYGDTVRYFQWDKIKERLAFLDSIRSLRASWAVLQNYRNRQGEAALIRRFNRNEYGRVADSLGIERYQSVPLYEMGDFVSPERYGRDGALVRLLEKKDTSDFVGIETLYFKGKWMAPKRYVHELPDTVVFDKTVFIDRTNQNIITLEKIGNEWLIRSMNPATTGVHRPPYMQETPLGIFLIQEKKEKMIYLVDGSTEKGGFAPYASRFTNGGYIHGVPVNAPYTTLIEYSATLGTIPRSHMCVRNATSHAKFIYDWAPVGNTVVFVFD